MKKKNVNEHCTEVQCSQKLIKVANDVKLFVKKGDLHRTFTALGLKVSCTSFLMRKSDYVLKISEIKNSFAMKTELANLRNYVKKNG